MHPQLLLSDRRLLSQHPSRHVLLLHPKKWTYASAELLALTQAEQGHARQEETLQLHAARDTVRCCGPLHMNVTRREGT